MAPTLCSLRVQARLCRLFWDAAGEAATSSVIPGQGVGEGGVWGGRRPRHPALCIGVPDEQLRRALASPGGSNLPASDLEKIWTILPKCLV